MADLDLPQYIIYILEYLNKLIGSGSRLWPGYVLAFIFIAFAIYKMERPKTGFWAYAFPKEFYTSESVKTDIKLWVFNNLLRVFDVFSRIGVRAVVAIYVINLLGGNTTAPPTLNPLWITLFLFVASDFWSYLYHRLHHQIEPLWVFHAVHHSSEFLVPISNYREHPIYGVFSRSLAAVIFGAIDGILLAIFVNSIDVHTLVGVNTLSFIYAVTGNNLRHSHIWLSYGPYLSYLFISPAMHQIHHSRDPKHYNKNYGNALAIFDWIGGSLYIPKKREDLEFGLCDAQGNPIQPHNGFKEAIIVPFIHLSQWWKNRHKENPNELQRANPNP